MRGVRDGDPTTTEPFLRYFELVQEAAREAGGTYFILGGDGDVEYVGDMECETLTGWVVPDGEVEAFEPLWEADEVDNSYDHLFATAHWEKSGNGVNVTFNWLFRE